jgi:hypothetical protein
VIPVGHAVWVPQCQRSPNRTVLPDAVFGLAPGVVRCPGAPYSPGCAGGELYVALSAGPLVGFMDASLRSCALEFGVGLDAAPTTLWLGQAPLTVPDGDGFAIYLAQGSDLDQYRYQIAHESFHRVCGVGVQHWVHELLAELFAYFRLRQAGHGDYAAGIEARAVRSASLVSLAELHRWSGGSEPAYYARAYMLGIELVKCCGWAATCQLAHYYDDQSQPDPWRWAQALGGSLATDALAIMGL